LTIHRIFNQHASALQSPASYFNVSTIDRAKCLFVGAHVFQSQAPFHYMHDFYPPRESDGFMIKSVQAVCLLYLANDSGRAEITRMARLKYSEALAETREALGRKDTVKRKEALLTVLLMDCFEKLSRDEPAHTTWSIEPTADAPSHGQEDPARNDIQAESRHLVGALALCKLRGPSQFQDPTSIAIFHHLSCNLLHSCTERKAIIPADYMQLRAEAANFIPANHQKWRAEALVINFMDFRSTLQTGIICEEDANETMKRLEKEYAELCKVFPHAKNHVQRRNELCSFRGLMDGLFEECDAMMLRRDTN
jgi:hypothetical protein